jgi:hypothetical protein
MFKIDSSTASPTQPVFAPAGTQGSYTAGSIPLGIAPTTISGDALNIIQDEIAYVVTQTGGTLAKANTGQLYAATQVMIAVETGRAETAEALKPNLATNNAFSGTTNNFVQVVASGGVYTDIVEVRNNTNPSLYLQNTAGTTNYAYLTFNTTNNVLYLVNGASSIAIDGSANLTVGGSITAGAGASSVGGTFTAAGAISATGNINANSGRLRAAIGASSATGGSGTDTDCAALLGDFQFSQNTNGYAVLPNGLLLQWGNVSLGTAPNQVVNFNKSYSSACFFVTASYGSVPSGTSSCGAAPTSSLTQFLIGNAGGGTNQIFWLAIGL